MICSPQCNSLSNNFCWCRYQRKNSLLLEYQQRGKTNVFLDHRFGEQDDSLGDEDKAILRFQKERMVGFCHLVLSLSNSSVV